jgi:ferredoxin
VHVIDQDKCTKCGQCLEVCPPKVSAVRKVSGREAEELVSLPEPVSVAEWRKQRAAQAHEERPS